MAPSPVRSVSPPDWAANGSLVIPQSSGYAGAPRVQIAGSRPGRVALVVSNIGATQCELQSSQQSSDTGNRILAGGSFTLECEGEVWVSSLNGTTVDVIETWFSRRDDASDALVVGQFSQRG